MVTLPIILLTSLVSQCSYSTVHKYIFPSDYYLSHLCACVITYRTTDYTPTYLHTLWLVDMRLLQLVSIHFIGALSYDDIYFYFEDSNILILEPEMLIPLNALTFLSKLYENQFLKFINDYFTYHKLLEDTSCNLDSLSIVILNSINL